MKIIKNIIWKHFRFSAIQYKFMRKWLKGTYYLVINGLPMCFWKEHDTKNNINSCQGRIVSIEVYPKDGSNPTQTIDSFDRTHLWLHHSHDNDNLFVNDRGLFCHCCKINFKTDTINEINQNLRK